MEEYNIPQDDQIKYFKENIFTEKDLSFQSIFIGCPKHSKLPLVIIFSIILGAYFIFTTFIGNILLVPLAVDGSSMYPTLNITYTTTGNKTAQDVVYVWQTKSVNRSDIIVFNANRYTGVTQADADPVYYIKRVIAIGGDSLQFKIADYNETTEIATYDVYLNGTLLDEPYISSKISYHVNSSRAQIVIQEQQIIIPNGHIFVMGDNRNNSKDSREMGLIKTEDILGKMVIHIPFGKTFIYGVYSSLKNDYLF